MEPGRDGDDTWNMGAGIMLRLGGRGPGSLVPPGVMARGGSGSGDNARCMSVVVGSASSHCISERARKWDRDDDGPGICDGVFVRERGEVAFTLGVWERDGGRGGCVGLVDAAVETEEVIGDHGRDDAIELRETLRTYGEEPEGVAWRGVGATPSERDGPMTDGRRRRSWSILVEEFHGDFDSVFLPLIVTFASGSSLLDAGDDSGVNE